MINEKNIPAWLEIWIEHMKLKRRFKKSIKKNIGVKK